MENDRERSEILYAGEVFRATERAMQRGASLAHEDLKRGLNTLATITCIAPFFGILGTLWAISFDTFFGLGTEKSTALAMVANGISRACVPTALGLLVGLHSLWAYKYLRGRLSDFDREMADMSLDVINDLMLHRIRPLARIEGARHSLPYLEGYSSDLDAERIYGRRSASAALGLLLLAWCLKALCYFELDAVPLSSAISAGARSVAITFCCACLPAYALWVDVLHRKPTGIAPIAAALSLAWGGAAVFFPSLRF